MSYYTTIFPEGEFEQTDITEVEKEIQRSEAILQDCWEDIVAMCAASPSDPKEAVRQFKSDLTKYIEFYKVYCKECLNKQYLMSEEFCTVEDRRKSIDWNHFEYNYDPERGVEEEQKSIDYVKNKLVMLCAASPEKIFAKQKEDEQSNPLDYLNGELIELKEYLDESIYKKVFCELCVKYWDTHEEG